jgi:hypothetical protein
LAFYRRPGAPARRRGGRFARDEYYWEGDRMSSMGRAENVMPLPEEKTLPD